jgi:hypothetical protein
MGAGAAPVPAVNAEVQAFDGTRQPFGNETQFGITIIDGNQQQVSRDFYDEPNVRFKLPVHENLADNYTIVAWADGYKQAGFAPVHITAQALQIVKLMLIPENNQFNFAAAQWPSLKAARPGFAALFASGAADDGAAGARYSDLEDVQNGAVLACLLNLTTAMSQIFLPTGTPLDYIKMINWELAGDYKMAQDRFFGWADPAIITQLEAAKQQGEFADAPFGLHPGATRSYKQIQFGEANVQLTFHEGDKKSIGGVDCIMIEPDIDYYKDILAHLLLEVAVNAFGSLTDPRQVYVLRWIAGQHAGIPEFDPLYTIERA